jgi:hypothetical protein
MLADMPSSIRDPGIKRFQAIDPRWGATQAL